MSMQIARKVISHFHRRPEGGGKERLTEREIEILQLLVKGLTGPRIAGQLGISHGTVRAHLRAIYGKLHVQSRSEAATRFLDHQLERDNAAAKGSSGGRADQKIGPNGLFPGPRK